MRVFGLWFPGMFANTTDFTVMNHLPLNSLTLVGDHYVLFSLISPSNFSKKAVQSLLVAGCERS